MAADGPDKGDAPKSDLEKIRGTWLTVSLVNDGKTLVDENVSAKQGPTTKLVYEGNTWTHQGRRQDRRERRVQD